MRGGIFVFGQEVFMTRPGKCKGVATPIPLGLATLGATTFLMGFAVLFETRAAWPPYFAQAVLFGGLVELLAGMWAFAYGDPLGATTFSFVGAFYGWVGLGLLSANITGIHAAMPPAIFSVSSGMVLLVSGFVVMYLWVASFYESMAFNGTLLFLWVSMVLMAIFMFTSVDVLGVISGICALISGVIGSYGSFAEVYNATALEELMPLGEPAAIRERSEIGEQARIRRLHPTNSYTDASLHH
jgi:succinate-acetate transporter protein